MRNDKIGDIIPIGDGNIYQLYCYQVGVYSSWWTVQHFINRKFLWWKWTEWTVFEFTTNYGAGETKHTIELKHKDETDEELVWQAEMELDFLGVDYK